MARTAAGPSDSKAAAVLKEKMDLMHRLNMSTDQVKSTLSKHVEKSRQDGGWLFGVLSSLSEGERSGGALHRKAKNATDEDITTISATNPLTSSSDPVPNLLRLPILLSGLQKVIDNEPVAYGRYFQSTVSEDDYEALVKKDPHDIILWVNYAASSLPPNPSTAAATISGGVNPSSSSLPAVLTYSTLEKRSTNLNKALNVLSRALQVNRSSPLLWNFYLELYCRRGSDSDIRKLFEQALVGIIPQSSSSTTAAGTAVAGFVADCVPLWWRFVAWEKTPRRKAAVVCQLVSSVLMKKTYDFGKKKLYNNDVVVLV